MAATRPAALFDLDGTLTDPFEGITRSIRYALEKLGRPVPPAADLRWCIGPPLHHNFAELLRTQDETLIWKAVELYRERYTTIGKFENRVIGGIPEALKAFTRAGYFLSLATSKPLYYARDILDHFDLSRHFDAVHGAEPDGLRSDKAELIRHILNQEPVNAARTVMIGDRSHDILGARANGVAAIGVLWGYGSRDELAGAGAAAIVAAPNELLGAAGRVLAGVATDNG